VGLAGKPRSGGSQNSAGRGQILTILQGNSRSIAQKSGEIWTGQADLQPISFKSDRLLDACLQACRIHPHFNRSNIRCNLTLSLKQDEFPVRFAGLRSPDRWQAGMQQS
jgi:hypothetical protein